MKKFTVEVESGVFVTIEYEVEAETKKDAEDRVRHRLTMGQIVPEQIVLDLCDPHPEAVRGYAETMGGLMPTSVDLGTDESLWEVVDANEVV